MWILRQPSLHQGSGKYQETRLPKCRHIVGAALQGFILLTTALKLSYYLFINNVCECEHALVEAKDALWESFLSFYRVGHGSPTQAISFGTCIFTA